MKQTCEIRLYLENPGQLLFEESSHYRKRKIRKDAEEFILEEAKAFGRKTRFKIIIHLAGKGTHEENFEAAIHAHFAYCRRKTDRERKRTIQYGWRILIIALLVLGVALSLSQMLANFFPHNSIAGTAVESLTILGWVAFWKPVELLLYAWYPFQRDRVLYLRLEESEVQVTSG